MKIYTRGGDSGMTSLMNGIRVSKADDRIELLGTIDELSSHIGLAKVLMDANAKEKLSKIQNELIGLMAGIADPRDLKYKIKEEQITYMEEEIDAIESSFPREKKFVLYGGCELSARLDVARAVARRAERRFRKVHLHYGVDLKAVKYINRLSDYLYVMARQADYKTQNVQCSEIDIEKLVQDIVKDMNI